MKRTRRSREVVRVRVPEQHAAFFYVPCVGWHVSLTWNWGDALDVRFDQLEKLLSSAKSGSVVIGRKMTAVELKRFLGARSDADNESHAHIIPNDVVRWRSRRY